MEDVATRVYFANFHEITVSLSVKKYIICDRALLGSDKYMHLHNQQDIFFVSSLIFFVSSLE